jgi:DNA-binding response OmpR family regulator
MPAEPTLGGKRVVVVEDEPVVKNTIEAVLGDAGAIIVRAFDHKLDAAILDVRLGYGITSLPIAMTLELRGVPFVFCTAYVDTVMPVIKRRWPRCTILPKPVSTDDLIGAVAALLDPQSLRLRA